MFKKDENQSKPTTPKSVDFSQIFIGILLLGIGLYILSTRVIVHSNWYVWRIGNLDISSGAVTIPLIIGVIWCVIDPKSIIAKILTTLSAIFIVVSIILSVRLNFISTSLFIYILIFGLIAVGSGLLLKNLFRKS